MKKKKLIGIALSIALMLSVGVVAYAAAGGFTMTYLPGTSDTVTNLPDADSGVGGQPYTVSDKIPQREGYEFLGWTLDFGVANTYTLTYQVTGDPTYGVPGDTATPNPVTGIREGGNVTLATALDTAWETADGNEAPTTENYKVNYLEVGTDKVLAPQKVVENRLIGSTVTESAIDIDGYTVEGDDPQNLTIKQSQIGKWTFTGWCSDEDCTQPITEVTNITADTTVYGKWKYEVIDLAKNEITFYYKARPAVLYTDYIVSYIDIETGEKLIPDAAREHYEIGSTQTEYAPEIAGYEILPGFESITFEVMEGKVVTFLYYYVN